MTGKSAEVIPLPKPWPGDKGFGRYAEWERQNPEEAKARDRLFHEWAARHCMDGVDCT